MLLLTPGSAYALNTNTHWKKQNSNKPEPSTKLGGFTSNGNEERVVCQSRGLHLGTLRTTPRKKRPPTPTLTCK